MDTNELKIFEDLLGKTIVNIKVNVVVDDEIIFTLDTGEKYKLYHSQDCCEQVYIHEIVGNLESILNQPILLAEEVTNTDREPLDKYGEDYLWTFYKLATNLGNVTISWYGSSNGYYSVEVDFGKV